MSLPASLSFLAWMPGPWELGIVLVIVLIFFGIGKLPQVLGQLGSGVKAFKDGMRESEDDTISKALDANPETRSEGRSETKVADAEELRA
jgi:sec-independent protein translocase protein TatA